MLCHYQPTTHELRQSYHKRELPLEYLSIQQFENFPIQGYTNFSFSGIDILVGVYILTLAASGYLLGCAYENFLFDLFDYFSYPSQVKSKVCHFFLFVLPI